jgi:AraC family transcriptional activator of pobA
LKFATPQIMADTSIRQFYQDLFGKQCAEADLVLGDVERHDVGHFNVFDISQLFVKCSGKPMMYNRRTYYKISLIHGENRVEYADKVVEVDDYAILFATPKIPYRYVPKNPDQQGHFCVFTREFMTRSKTGMALDELPIFKPNSDFVFHLDRSQYEELRDVFTKMHEEIASDYEFKYDLLRNYVIQLIHFGQKLQPTRHSDHPLNAATRITSLFIELLERQFPIDTAAQANLLRHPKEFAETLNVHVNHLNKVLKESTGKTTSEIINSRFTQEAKILLRQTTLPVSEVAYSLGFDEVAHFSNFFKKNAGASPMAFRA